MLAIIPLLVALASGTGLTLAITPAHDFSYDGKDYAEYTFRIRFEDARPRMICTGWYYPILQQDQEDWPRRTSCRVVTSKLVMEYWGGKRSPLPYIGDYIGFVQIYVDGRPDAGAGQKFTVLEGIPR